MNEARNTGGETCLCLPALQYLPVLLNTKQAAQVLNVSERTVTRLCKEGEIHAALVGRQWRLNRDELLKQFGIA